jgi:hypothetical protein
MLARVGVAHAMRPVLKPDAIVRAVKLDLADAQQRNADTWPSW